LKQSELQFLAGPAQRRYDILRTELPAPSRHHQSCIVALGAIKFGSVHDRIEVSICCGGSTLQNLNFGKKAYASSLSALQFFVYFISQVNLGTYFSNFGDHFSLGSPRLVITE
jgi:hypothetical protein